jgi:hypothetical protein
MTLGYQFFHGLTWDENSNLLKIFKLVQSAYLKVARFLKYAQVVILKLAHLLE